MSSSSLFPNRPIRPLPKRRLRERLSPEVAGSIRYPVAPQSIPLFPYAYTLRNDESEPSFALSRERAAEPRQSRHGLDVDGEEHAEDSTLRRGPASRAAPASPDRLARPLTRTEHGRHGHSQHPHSTASSVDGYDSFENANNKKKRKVPITGDTALNVSYVTTYTRPAMSSIEGHGELSAPPSMGQHGPLGLGAQNIPGPGRGRYGRLRSGRSPLRPLSDSTNNWAGRNGKLRSGENTGIISTAIANANAEKLPSHQGQENISLLQQQVYTKRGPASSQFTFTCNSKVPLSWPDPDRRPAVQMHQAPGTRHLTDGLTRTLPKAQASHSSAALPQAGDAAPKETCSKAGVAGQAGSVPKSTRKSVAKEYAAAARARRRETQSYNKRHPPKPDEIWICHFCEYESIFGHPPEALVRQYEIKDRKQRQLEQQRKAQWERLKKGKHKGKKSNKLPPKTNDAAQDLHQPAGSHGAPMNGSYSQGTQSEEYYDDEDYEDEDYEPDEDIPPEIGIDIPDRQDKLPVHPGQSSAVLDGGGT
ncbi:hypothetical protein B0T19DRAFT_436497 [Cercophora scortea]|uniref:Uncharacterized protein n=1 Tax=Cercophora scortea TaxID=314031 RepID=A0AAE0J2F9_9PEZI|nr:hypothetical protein B0T19DRAFT_436497 [Cercophora scortea]